MRKTIRLGQPGVSLPRRIREKLFLLQLELVTGIRHFMSP